MLRKIVLHGKLRESFGESFMLDVVSPAEAIRALCYMVEGFRAQLREGYYKIIRGPIEKDVFLSEKALHMKLGKAQELHIVPVIAGAGSPWFSIILGVILVAAAFLAPYALPAIGIGTAATFAAGTIGGSITGLVASVGAGLALSGASALLAPSPKMSNADASIDQRQSFLFGGQTNVGKQGGPVPLVYGRMRVGSVIISAGITTEQLGTAGAYGTASSN